ncbi:hypothetical protein I203_106112 [Kwoniella mangroviensis CBS 8507]|uniref:uncharacterized protein n=1 Tax=Kwoniella mangroviensis CBS 8507 TaxID=1296122 RepID=UPI00080CF452|nr:uncharacterized protein I203_04588 [Kwoniella mangroviensis CBS 8507]OCF66261.1 hypothetical protein I203_04588 [Kwoniella mangroviensis CBS 8507]
MNSLNTTSAPPPLGEQPITPMKPFVASPSPKTLTSRIISSLRYTFNFCPYRDKVFSSCQRFDHQELHAHQSEYGAVATTPAHNFPFSNSKPALNHVLGPSLRSTAA